MSWMQVKDGALQGIPDGKGLVHGQRVDEFVVQLADSGPDGKPVGEIDVATDPCVSRTVWVRVDAGGWLIENLIRLLPPDLIFVSRHDETTFAIGAHDFLKIAPAEAWQRVENTLAKLTALMHIYSPNQRLQVEVTQIQQLHASGRQVALKRYKVTVSEWDGFAKLAQPMGPNGSTTRAALLLQLAHSNGRISEALAFMQAPEPGWAAVYDALKVVKNSTVATSKAHKVNIYSRTANHYRHLGEPGRAPLPATPPTLAEARSFAFYLLADWLELRLKEELERNETAPHASGVGFAH